MHTPPEGAARPVVEPRDPAATPGETDTRAAAPVNAFFTAEAEPEPVDHRPTDAEYRDLLQEFSVMFRLDRRSRRQRIGMGLVLAALLIGVTVFGSVLYVRGQQRQTLRRDARAMIEMVSLPFQTKARVQLRRQQTPPTTTTQAKSPDPLVLKTIGRRTAKPKKPRRGPYGLTDAQVRALHDEARVGAKNSAPRLRLDKPLATAAQVTRAACTSAARVLARCARQAGGSLQARIHISNGGRVTTVTAKVDGHPSPTASECVARGMKAKHFHRMAAPAVARCKAD